MSFTKPTISGYNSSPPSDDGAETSTNETKWSFIKEKLSDPVKTLTEALATATDSGLNIYAADTGAADAYAISVSSAIASYTAGDIFRFKATYANTGASTLNVNGLGAKNILTQGLSALGAGAILAGGIYIVVYDGTQFQLQEPFQETGSWTPAMSFGGGTTGITYDANTSGTYVKNGKLVVVTGYLVLTSKGTDTGTATITGLPKTNGTGYGNTSCCFLRCSAVANSGTIQGAIERNTTQISLSEINTAGTTTAITDADFSNTSAIYIQATYIVD